MSVIVDYPNSAKAKKIYIILDTTGFSGEEYKIVAGKTGDDSDSEGEPKKANFIDKLKL